jgi:hypothetical protein
MTEKITTPHGPSYVLARGLIALLSVPDTGKGRMQRHVLGVLLEHRDSDPPSLPTNGRFVFYELEGAGVVRKSRKGESRRGSNDDPREQEVTDALIWLRDKGVVPWDWIDDETRVLYDWRQAGSIAEWLSGALGSVRINPWPTDPPLVLVESRSLGGPLRPVARKYVCPITATNGQARGHLVTEVVPLLRGSDRPVVYLGDWDHQGHQIEANTRRVLEQEARRRFVTGETWTRAAITPEQIAERGLRPVWKRDGRYTPPLEHDAWEAEALTQGTLLEILDAELERLLAPVLLDDVLEREAEEREELRTRLEGLA